MHANMNAGPANNRSNSKHQKSALGKLLKEESTGDRDRSGGMVGWKRPVCAAVNQQVCDASVIRSDPMDGEQDQLIYGKSQYQRQTRANSGSTIIPGARVAHHDYE